MMMLRCATACLALGLFAAPSPADDAKKRLLLVTDSGGFIHDSVGFAEQTLKKIGPSYGFEVECYRFTRDPDQKITASRPKLGPDGKPLRDPKGKEVREQYETTLLAEYAERFRKTTGVPVEREHCGRVNAGTLKKFDCVLFFTTGSPLNQDEIKDLVAWVKDGGAVAGTHCGSDTLYPAKDRPWNEAYGQLIGAYFKTHPPGFQKIKVRVEDPKHPAGKAFKDGEPYEDEIYIFRDEPYSREKLHIILSVTADSVDSLLEKAPKAGRKDNDYGLSWCQEVGKGRSFYTAFGHRKEVWADKRFQEHLFGGLNWAVKRAEGSATPSARLKK